VIGNASLERWRHPQGLVPADEIVVEVVQGDGVLQVFDFLAEPSGFLGPPCLRRLLGAQATLFLAELGSASLPALEPTTSAELDRDRVFAFARWLGAWKLACGFTHDAEGHFVYVARFLVA
jgi:hypothetical protein